MTQTLDPLGAAIVTPPLLFAGRACLLEAASACGLGLWQWRAETGRVEVNAACAELLGMPAETTEFQPDRFVMLVHGDDIGVLQEAFAAAQDAEGALLREFRISREDTGELRWLAAKACIIEPQDGGERLLAGICLDVTARRQEQEARDLLNQEIEHRMKNLLSIVGSLVSLSGERRPEARDFIADFQARLNGLAATHALLLQSNWYPIRLGDLATKVLSPLGVNDRVDVGGATGLRLSPHDAHTLALVLHELATNAIKHGALSNLDGQVRLSFGAPSAVRAGEMQPLHITWEETGGPPVQPPSAKGFGVTFIERLTKPHGQAAPLLTWAETGLRCRFCFDLTPVAP